MSMTLIASHAAQMLQGDLTVASVLGQGSVVRLTLKPGPSVPPQPVAD